MKLTTLKIHRYRDTVPGTELRFSPSLNLVLGRNAPPFLYALGTILAVFLCGRREWRAPVGWLAAVGLTLLPYWIRTWSAIWELYRSAIILRRAKWTSSACSLVATLPVPIAQTGS